VLRALDSKNDRVRNNAIESLTVMNYNAAVRPLYTHLVNYSPNEAEAEQFKGLVAPLGIAEQVRPFAGFMRDWNPAELDAAHGIDPPYIALHVGASTRYKEWPDDAFLRCAEALHNEDGLGVALVGGAGDGETARALADRLRRRGVDVANVAGERPLRATAAILRDARLFLGADSGLAHLAAALDTPTVVLFGPSDARKWGVQRPGHAVVQGRLPCAPCFIFGYHKPCRTIDCMAQISPDEVIQSCRKVLGEGSDG